MEFNYKVITYTYFYSIHCMCKRYFVTTRLKSNCDVIVNIRRQKLSYQQCKNYSKNSSKLSDRTNIREQLMSLEKFKAMIKNSKHSYVVEKDIAERLVTSVQKIRANPKSPVLEINAGPGLVSREFLKQGVTKLVALETSNIFVSYVKELKKEFGSHGYHHFAWPMLSFAQKLDISQSSGSASEYSKSENTVAQLLSDSSDKESGDDVPYSVFSLGGKDESQKFMFYIIRNLPNGDSILSKDFVEFFFLTHPSFMKKMEKFHSLPERNEKDVVSYLAEKNYLSYVNATHVMLHLLYDISFHDEFDANSFLPPLGSLKQAKNGDFDVTKRILTKLQLKRNICDLLPLEQHVQFFTFLQQIYKKKRVRIIPAMEMLVPGCGLRMLYEGFSMLECVGTVQPKYFLHLYKSMQNWPEYETSTLRQHISLKVVGGLDQKDLDE